MSKSSLCFNLSASDFFPLLIAAAALYVSNSMYITSLFTRLLFEAFLLSHSNVYTVVDDDGMAWYRLFFAALHYVNPE